MALEMRAGTRSVEFDDEHRKQARRHERVRHLRAFGSPGRLRSGANCTEIGTDACEQATRADDAYVGGRRLAQWEGSLLCPAKHMHSARLCETS